MRTTHLLMMLALAPLAGCATHAVDQNYGSAYEQLVQLQTYDVATRNTSQKERVIEGTDPDMANAALEAMRKDTADRAGVKPAPFINITQQGGGGGSQ
jgi:uncharacterized protein (UPF0261 family)